MEDIDAKRYACKYCSKRYPCGKSLGGHMRIHLNGDAPASQDRRENRKKTKKLLTDLRNPNLQQQKVCKECGKGFQSMKALCGHMASHSKNNANLEDHFSVAGEKMKTLVTDVQSDTENSAPSKKRRSERIRCKPRYAANNAFSGNDSPSTESDLEHEQEEIAKCLMMLSRDSSFKGCYGDSSDNYWRKNGEFKSKTSSATQEEEEEESENGKQPKRVKNESYELPESDLLNNVLYDSPKSSKNTHSSPMKKKKKKTSARKQKKKSGPRKLHGCPYCSKVFRSGQALGGHKRSHLVGNAEEKVPETENERIPPLIDLNLPAPSW